MRGDVMASGKSNLSKTGVWIILALLILGLAGFGATNFSGQVRNIGYAGDQAITVSSLLRELDRESRAIQQQTGQALTSEQMRAFGLDQRALARLVAQAALDQEAADLGLSVGDARVQAEVLNIEAFKGLDGQFDRETYRFALDRVGLSEGEFEEDLRREAARQMMQGAIAGGVRMPAVMTETVLGYVGERRNFTWARMTDSALIVPVEEPTKADLQAWYDANIDSFTLPESKTIRYVWLTPEMILDDIEIDDAALRTLFEERRAEYELPERRLVEKLVFANEEAASSAMAQLDVNGTTFGRLVEDRGLSLGDVDLGDVTIEDLEEAGAAVFAAEPGAVVGPLPTSLGPALFRVNGVLAAQNADFDSVRDELRDELAGTQARRRIEALAEEVNDELAGGATLDEVAGNTALEAGQIDWFAGQDAGIAAYNDFNAAAERLAEGDFAEIDFLDDGGIFAIELAGTQPPRPEPLESARDRVAAGWRAEQVQTALSALAEPKADAIRKGASFAAEGLEPATETDMLRTGFIEAMPEDFVTTIFDMQPAQVQVIPAGESVVLVRLDAVLPPEDNEDARALREALARGQDDALAQAIFRAYERDVQLRIRPQIDQNALTAVMSGLQ